MKILAIDPGTACGYAFLDGELMVAGTLDLAPKRHEGGGMRYLRFRRALAGMLEGVEHLAYEEVRRHAGTSAAHVYGGLVAEITAACEDRNIPYAAYPVGTIKKTATGKGNAGKDEMMQAARVRWPEFEGDDNEADARWLAITAAQALA